MSHARFALLAALAAAAAAHAAEPFPTARPANRFQAVAAVSGGAESGIGCLTPLLAEIRQQPALAPAAGRRALALLLADRPLQGETRWTAPDGTVFRYTLDRSVFDRVDVADGDPDGVPALVRAAAAGVADASELLVRRLEFPSPGPVEVVLARLGSGVEGARLPGHGGRGSILLLENAPSLGAEGVRRAAAHQYAHAVAAALGSGLPSNWGEALAGWVSLRLDGSAGPGRPLAAVADRFARLREGLDADDLGLAAGDAAFFEFLHEAYGPTALRIVVDEISSGAPRAAALDRGLRRSIGVSFDAAFRDFQLWTLFTGDRADRRHFSFAAALPSPRFAARADGLPALSVLSDPAVSPLGAAAVAISPRDGTGGMTLRFEGEFGARWAADLLLSKEGSLQRVPLSVSAEGRGEVSVPLEGVREAVLLVRRLDDADPTPRRYTWSAFRDAAYPVEFGSVTAEPDASGALQVSWDTGSESGVLGFNVYRYREGSAERQRVNPVWVPAVGDRSAPASYRFVDAEADLSAAYVYRIEAVTPEGLTTLSDPSAPLPSRR